MSLFKVGDKVVIYKPQLTFQSDCFTQAYGFNESMRMFSGHVGTIIGISSTHEAYLVSNAGGYYWDVRCLMPYVNQSNKHQKQHIFDKITYLEEKFKNRKVA